MKYPLDAESLAEVHFDEHGLVPVVAQDEATGAVLMLAWATREALAKSLDSGRMTYWSRSRNALWTKGETSGHTQKLVGLYADCDRDAVLAIVQQSGPACHEDTGSCWSSGPETPAAGILGVLDRMAEQRKQKPTGGYTDSVLASPAFAASKVEEEAGEVGAVLRGEDNEDSLEHEAADLLYHLVVALRGSDSSLSAVLGELWSRHGQSHKPSGSVGIQQ